MAGDLIPPPSPAGRPEPDSSEKRERRADGGLWSGGEEEAGRLRPAVALAVDDPAQAAEPAREEAAALAATPAVPSPYRSRFGFVLGALIGVALAAAALAVALVMDTADDGVPENWSAWSPSAQDQLGAAKQIAAHVAPKYRLGDGDQLVAVQSSGLEVANLPLRVALRTAASGGDIKLIEGDGVMYTLNGLGEHGSIAGGEPTEARHLLLRREALELALYTFRYADDVDMVVALLPPPPPEKGAPPTAPPEKQALFFRPGDLKERLDVPLGSTIPPRTPRPETFPVSAPEAKRIESLTRGNLFVASFQQSQDANAFLVLDRAP